MKQLAAKHALWMAGLCCLPACVGNGRPARDAGDEAGAQVPGEDDAGIAIWTEPDASWPDVHLARETLSLPDGYVLADGGLWTAPSYAYARIAAGDAHSCALRTDGTAACWGSNSYGQASPPDGTFAEISCAASYCCGLRSSGSVICWGQKPPSPPALSFTHISMSAVHACGLLLDGSAACWGDNTFGQSTPVAGA